MCSPHCDALKKDTLFRTDPPLPTFCLSSIKAEEATFSFQMPHKCFQNSLSLQLPETLWPGIPPPSVFLQQL